MGFSLDINIVSLGAIVEMRHALRICLIIIQYGLWGLQHPHARTMRAIWRIYTPTTRTVRTRKILHAVLHAPHLHAIFACILLKDDLLLFIHAKCVYLQRQRTDLHQASTAMHSQSETLISVAHVLHNALNIKMCFKGE